jgi:hypothetical protein
MITLTREEAQQVLDALEAAYHPDTRAGVVMEIIANRLSAPEPPCKTGSQCIGGKCPQCAPPQREWVGLTDEEMFDIYGQNHEGKKYNLGRLVEAKLKDKNK